MCVTLSSAHCPTPATQKRRRPRDTGGEGRRRDARAYIRPFGCAHCPTPATQKQRRPRDTGGTPEGRQGVHPTPWQCTLSHACHAKAAETPWQCTLSHACHAKAAETNGHHGDTGGTPGRTSDPLAVHIVPRLPRKSSGDQGTPEGHRRDADPLAVHIVPRLPRKSSATQKQRRPRDTGGTPGGRAYIRPLGSAHCPTPATQKQRRPRDTGGTPEGRQGVHPTPWQCTLSHACHPKAAE